MKYFTTEEALENIKEALENGYNGYYCDLQNTVFSTDYYLTGIDETVSALIEYGILKAIDKVISYEQDNLGEVNTKLQEPEDVSNMLWYIIGEETISKLYDCKAFNDNYDNIATEETNVIIVEYINNMLK